MQTIRLVSILAHSKLFLSLGNLRNIQANELQIISVCERKLELEEMILISREWEGMGWDGNGNKVVELEWN